MRISNQETAGWLQKVTAGCRELTGRLQKGYRGFQRADRKVAES
jgi:hypothetical protein